MTWNDHLLELVQTGTFRKQGELVDALAERGFVVHQGSVSRELRSLGVTKVRGVYVVPDTPQGAPLHDFQVTAGGCMVVLRTLPAFANVLAQAIDASDLSGCWARLRVMTPSLWRPLAARGPEVSLACWMSPILGIIVMRICLDKIASSTASVGLRSRVVLGDQIPARFGGGGAGAGRKEGLQSDRGCTRSHDDRASGDLVAGVLGKREALRGFAGKYLKPFDQGTSCTC